MAKTIIFAIPKGRILDEALPLMRAAGIEPAPDFFDPKSRALKFATTNRFGRADVEIIRVRAFDVATFVAHGAAHIGIVGSDVVDEFNYSELYAPVDLNIGHCRLSVAEPAGLAAEDFASLSHVRVATKYPGLTRRFFESHGVQAECVKLNGAMELAPLLGLSRRIVDLVSSGATLRENGLVETHRIMDISARLIVNRAAFKMMSGSIPPMVDAFRALVEQTPIKDMTHATA